MGSLFHNLQRGGGALLVSQSELKVPCGATGGLRKRLSPLSLYTQPSMISTSTYVATSCALRRSKSVSVMGKRHFHPQLLSRKPTFAENLEMNEESTLLGCHKDRWRYVFYKVKSEPRKLVESDHVGPPQIVKYDSPSKTFGEGLRSFLKP